MAHGATAERLHRLLGCSPERLFASVTAAASSRTAGGSSGAVKYLAWTRDSAELGGTGLLKLAGARQPHAFAEDVLPNCVNIFCMNSSCRCGPEHTCGRPSIDAYRSCPRSQ
jgi:hypothetical protein